jgi:integrase
LIITGPIPKKNTVRNYSYVLGYFQIEFGERDVESITPDEILGFLTELTTEAKQTTKRLRYSNLKSFFNHIQSTFLPSLNNPCDSPTLKKTFRSKGAKHWPMIEKDIIDEIIFRTDNPRNRLMLELMARGGMRIGEVLNLRPKDHEGCKLMLSDTKGGRETEVAFIPQKISDRLKDYIQTAGIESQARIFPISYTAAWSIVVKAGKLVGIHLRPHDLRRHAATYASRAGTPIEIISKVLLRHQNLSTTQRYLGKVSDTEAMRWIENLYG